MKLSPETLTIFKNLAGISSGLYAPGGSKIRVRNDRGTVLAEAHLKEDLPSFCVFDLNKFLGLLTVDKDVEMDISGPNVVLSMLKGKSKLKYRCAPKELVKIPKDKDFTISESDAFASFTLTKDTLAFTDKVLSLLGLRSLAFEYENGDFFIRVFDPNNDGENEQTLQIEGVSVKDVSSFQMIFDSEWFNFVPGDYRVLLTDGYAQFKHSEVDVSYWVTPTMESSIER